MATEERKKNEYTADTYLYWKTQLESAKDDWDKFITQGRKIVERYRGDDRGAYERRYNILYSNTDTLEPVVFSKNPQPEVRANDTSNIAERKAAGMLEDSIAHFVGKKSFKKTAKPAVKDYLLPGLGVIRPKYNPLIAPDEELDTETVLYEEVKYEYVYWEDFLMPDCPWEIMPWVAFRSFLTFDEVIDMLEKGGMSSAEATEKANMLKYSPRKRGVNDIKMSKNGQRNQNTTEYAEVWEIWDKDFREQIFWSEGLTKAPLDINDDPLGLDGFFPVPKPLLSIETSDTIIPIPFYKTYEDQALELDDVNGRLSHMMSNMRRRGFYDASLSELGDIANMGDNTFYPLKNWSEFTSKGGIGGAMQMEDITTYAQISTILREWRQQLLEDIFQIIGVSDIRRAQTDPRETLGAQKLKSRYGTIRISTYQEKVAEYMRDLMRITGEIIVSQFDAQTISIITGIPLESKIQDGQVAAVGTEDLLKMLREQEPLCVSVDIQTDSTIIEDEEGQRAELRDGIEAMAQYTAIAQQVAQGVGAEAASKVGMKIIERFKLGRDIQQEVEDHIAKTLADPPEPQPQPEEIIAQVEMQKAQLSAKVKESEVLINAQLKASEYKLKEMELVLKARELGIKADFQQDTINIKALEALIKQRAVEAEAATEGNEFVGV